MNGWRAAWTFLTVFPAGGRAPERRDLQDACAFFPLVGLALGAGLWAASRLLGGWPPLLTGAVLAVGLSAATGGLHLDALGDAVDGWAKGGPPEARLAVMRDPHVGAMGVLAIASALLLKWAAFTELASAGAVAAWLVVPVFSRTVMAWCASAGPVRPGLAEELAPRPGGAPWQVALAVAILLFVLLWRAWTLPVLVAGVLAASLWRRLMIRTLGALPGDAIGAAGELAEVVGFVVAAGLSA